MCLTEHLMYWSNDWDKIFPSWIKYVKNNDKIFIECDDKHIKKAQSFRNYLDDNENKQINEINLVKKYKKTKNIDDLENLYDKNIKEY